VPQISNETKEQVLAATDIVDLIGSYIEVKRAGTVFKALCPFHNEKTASFNINPARQFFHCFGCGKSGDAITFVREYENMPFADAIRKLASRSGVVVKEEISDPKEDFARRQRGRLLEIQLEVTAFMHRQLMRSKDDAQHARDYLKSRGFGGEMAARWMVGWMPAKTEVFRSWAKEKGYSGRELMDAGLLRDGERGAYLLFRDRLMFPIRNDRGEVVAFSGRQLREDQGGGKYVNSPETVLFKKSNVLFALDRAKRAMLKEQSVVICEGQIDAIACHEQGIENVIAGQGTAFTPQHAQLLRRYYAKTAVLCYDADNAGFKGATGAFRQLAAENIAVKMIRMPAGEDPDSYMRKHGPDAFRELIANAQDFFDALMDRAQQEGKLETPESRALIQRDYAPLLSLIADPAMRDALVNKVATRLRSGSLELRGAVAREEKAAARKALNPRRKDEGPEEPAAVEVASIDPVVAYLCSLALQSNEAQNWLGEQFETLHEAGDYLEGIPVLETILSARPDADSPAAVNTFLATLPEPQRVALYADPTFHAAAPEDPHGAAAEALARLSAKWLMSRDARLKADLNQPGLTPEQQGKLLEEVKVVQGLIKGMGQRFMFDDRLGPSTRRIKTFENSKFPYSKRERNP
jgi:DNA primase